MRLVPLEVFAVPRSRSESPHQPSWSKKKQVMLVKVIPIRIHLHQHNIITIFKFTIITHKIIFITITITIISMQIISLQRRITIMFITQTHNQPNIITRTKFLIVVSLQLQVPEAVPTWEHTSLRISQSCRVKCLRHQTPVLIGHCPVPTRRCSNNQCLVSSAHRKTLRSRIFNHKIQAVIILIITTMRDHHIIKWSCWA